MISFLVFDYLSRSFNFNCAVWKLTEIKKELAIKF